MQAIDGNSTQPKLRLLRVPFSEGTHVLLLDEHSTLFSFRYQNESEYVLVDQFVKKCSSLLKELEEALEAPNTSTSGLG